MLPADEVEIISQKIIKKLAWKGPVFKISALKKQGTPELCYKLMERIEFLKAAA